MSLRVRKDGRILSGAHHPPMEGDIYIDDSVTEWLMGGIGSQYGLPVIVRYDKDKQEYFKATEEEAEDCYRIRYGEGSLYNGEMADLENGLRKKTVKVNNADIIKNIGDIIVLDAGTFELVEIDPIYSSACVGCWFPKQEEYNCAESSAGKPDIKTTKGILGCETLDGKRYVYKKIDDIEYKYNFNNRGGNNIMKKIESASVERLADELLDQIIEKLRVDKGINITKN